MVVTIRFFDTEGNLEYILSQDERLATCKGITDFGNRGLIIIDERSNVMGFWDPIEGKGMIGETYADYAYYIGAT